jgi:hypothetical protein
MAQGVLSLIEIRRGEPASILAESAEMLLPAPGSLSDHAIYQAGARRQSFANRHSFVCRYYPYKRQSWPLLSPIAPTFRRRTMTSTLPRIEVDVELF